MINVSVNGKRRELVREVSVSGLLETLDIDPKVVAVAINGEVVPKNQYPKAIVRESDAIEVVRMVGGGEL